MLFRVSWSNGVLVENDFKRILLDPLKVNNSAESLFISHAHKDHTCGFLDGSKLKYSTPQTVALFENIANKRVKNVASCAYGQPLDLHKMELRIVNSGHVFGSGALVLRDDDVTFLYTGDFNFTDSLTQKAIAPIECDIMVIETTYGKPNFSFPPRYEIYYDIIEWAAKTIKENHMPTFLVYPIGKAQEITKLFNSFTSIPVVTHPTISKVNEVINKFGDDLIYYDMLTDGLELINSKNCVCLFPSIYNPKSLRSAYPNAKIAITTGWALLYKLNKNINAAFPLSGHADFPQLTRFVSKCNPKKVFTIHGYSNEFATILKKMGIDAKPLNSFL